MNVETNLSLKEELIKRIYSVPGIEDKRSVVTGNQGLSIEEGVIIKVAEAIIEEREFAHIHGDASLHIFLEPSRAREVDKMCWGILHPWATPESEGWDGYTMLYTPQTIEEVDVTFQLIIDGFNYVTEQNLDATDYY